MKTTEHLTENQLNDYFGNSALEHEAKHAIGQHLLQCDFCLKRLPQPTPEHFWTALITENEWDEDSRDEKMSLISRLEFLIHLVKQPKVFAFSLSALALALFVSGFIWFSLVKSFNKEREIAESFETTRSIQPEVKSDETRNASTLPTGESNNHPSLVSASNKPNQGLLATKEIKPKQTFKNTLRRDSGKYQAKFPKEEKANISSIRGGTVPKCSELQLIDSTVGISNDTVILKWKRIPNAAKYHLYVSDDEEILVDEFETEQETTYALKKPLAPQKTYQWKVVVNLKDGKTIVGDSQKFTIKDLQSNQKKSNKKDTVVTRCSENKSN